MERPMLLALPCLGVEGFRSLRDPSHPLARALQAPGADGIARAVAMLEAREKQMPGSYEPPARLASTLFKLARFEEAKAAVERAIAKAYGPRKLGYLRLRAGIQSKLGDAAGALATLREEVRGWEALPPGQASPAMLEDARKRLAAAEAAPAK